MHDIVCNAAALSAFLKQASQELDQAFNSACAFGGTNEALRDHSMNMIRDVETIRSQAHELLKSSRLSTKRHARGKLVFQVVYNYAL